MRKSVKILLVVSVIIIVISIPAIFLISNVLKMGQKAQPFNLDGAPEHIIVFKTVLKDKLENETFLLDDLDDKKRFLNFSQWLADNSPDILDLIENWEQLVLFEIENSTYDMWWLIENNNAIVEVDTNPPQNYGILIELNSKTFNDILKQDETPLSAFIKGDLRYSGSFDEVLKVAQIVAIVSATLMDKNIPSISSGPTYEITEDEENLYIEGGLTLFPSIEVAINPDHIGESHKASPISGSVVIIDHKGKIVAELEGSSHSVHKFINSTAVLMGGQEGNMGLWDYKNDKVETLLVPGGHHDFDYNPATETFMILEYNRSDEIWDGRQVVYDMINEYDWKGDLVWQWDPRVYFPFNSTRHFSLGENETFRGGADWMHSNSFAWDKKEGVIYLNVRNLDTILKINYTTKEVIWDAGRDGDFSLLNKAGEEVDTIFCHPHGLEKIGSNRFIIYDNDLFNQSNPSTMTLENSSGHSRFLEFEIDEENYIMKEVWSWVPSDQSYYFPESGGDADRLPNGNTLGIFGDKGLVLNLRDPVIITEVTRNGTVAWELRIPGVNNTYYWVHQLERFYERPIISIQNHSIDLDTGEVYINLTTWNTIKQDATSPGILSLIADEEVIYQEFFEFKSQWQPNTFEIVVNNLPSNVKVVEIVIENSDGIKRSLIIYRETSSPPFLINGVMLIFGGLMVAIPSVIVFRESMKMRRLSEHNKE